jgi:hypothetical protein
MLKILSTGCAALFLMGTALSTPSLAHDVPGGGGGSHTSGGYSGHSSYSDHDSHGYHDHDHYHWYYGYPYFSYDYSYDNCYFAWKHGVAVKVCPHD